MEGRVRIGAFLAHKFTPLSMFSLPPFFAACFFARGLFDGNGERLLSVMERDDSHDDCLASTLGAFTADFVRSGSVGSLWTFLVQKNVATQSEGGHIVV